MSYLTSMGCSLKLQLCYVIKTSNYSQCLKLQNNMIQIASVPYEKTYRFPYISDAMALKVLLYGLSLVLPFFIVYSTNNFYLSFSDNITVAPQITYDYNYHIIIQTDTSIYTYSTLYKNTPSRSISYSYQNNDNQLTHTFTVNWLKGAGQKVKKVTLTNFMRYSTNGVNNGYGIIHGEGTGYDIADLNIVGSMRIENGMNTLQNPPTTNILSQYNYDVGATMLALQNNYNSYISCPTQYLTNNMPNNLLKVSFKVKANSVAIAEESASILGQLVWSFTQYFPIATVFWFVSKWVLGFLLRENVVKRYVIHDKF